MVVPAERPRRHARDDRGVRPAGVAPRPVRGGADDGDGERLVPPSADLLTARSPLYSIDAAVLALAWVTVTIVVTELARVRLERVAERRRARAEAEQQRARDERVRIARELHDSVAHSMSLINLQAGVALHLGATLPPGTRDSLTSIRDRRTAPVPTPTAGSCRSGTRCRGSTGSRTSSTVRGRRAST
ncbi:histidine kinase [Curtobacterium sp. Csp1]|nr:histidine kinase [Curtobacterium sp. Csp1]